MSESIVAEPDIFMDNAEEDNFDNVVPSNVPDAAQKKKKRRRPPPALIPIEEVAEVGSAGKFTVLCQLGYF